MFYFLIFHSSISKFKEIDKKLLTTILYASIMYIIFHAILDSYQSNNFLKIIKNYFWLIFILDISTMIYLYFTLIKVDKNIFYTIKKSFTNLFENISDTSIYKDNELDKVNDELFNDIKNNVKNKLNKNENNS